MLCPLHHRHLFWLFKKGKFCVLLQTPHSRGHFLFFKFGLLKWIKMRVAENCKTKVKVMLYNFIQMNKLCLNRSFKNVVMCILYRFFFIYFLLLFSVPSWEKEFSSGCVCMDMCVLHLNRNLITAKQNRYDITTGVAQILQIHQLHI